MRRGRKEGEEEGEEEDEKGEPRELGVVDQKNLSMCE